MSVYRMENFNVPDIAALNIRGFNIPANRSGFSSQVVDFTDGTATRRCLRISHDVNAAPNGVEYYGLPFPTNGEGYLSFRLRINNNGSARMVVFRVNLTATKANQANTAFFMLNSNLIGPTATGNLTGTQPSTLPFSYDRFYTVEVYRSAAGAYRMWVDDFLIPAAAGTTILTPSTTGQLQLAIGNGSGVSPPPVITTDLADVVAVDLTGTGLTYRPGKTSRVLPVSASADVIAEWTGGDGSPHYSQLADFSATVDATGYITASVTGKREQYQQASILPGFSQQVLSVGAEHYLSNEGGAVHTLTSEVDTGSGVASIGDITLSGGSGYVYRPVYADKKPNGSNWTYADVESLKSGFSIKS